jgi:hypothetical protein
MAIVYEGKWCGEVTVIDPDTGNEIEVAMYKHSNGAMFGIDSSYIEQVAEEDEEDETVCYVGDPFNYKQKVKLIET